MTRTEHLAGLWREWRHARIAELSRPYGWTALVAQHWLRPGEEPKSLEGLPGRYQIVDGRIWYTPPTEGPGLVYDGEEVRETVEVIPGRNQSLGHYSSVPIFWGESEVESIIRTDFRDEVIGAVRIRDPKVSAQRDFSGLTAYDYDPAWRLPAVFTPHAVEEWEAPTVEEGVRETMPRLGTLHVEVGGRPYDLLVTGKLSGRPEIPGRVPWVHVLDETAGDTTYENGRYVRLAWADAAQTQIDWIDFNYLVPLWCAFTNYVTCPLPPKENLIRSRITAGELKPVEHIERISTYAA